MAEEMLGSENTNAEVPAGEVVDSVLTGEDVAPAAGDNADSILTGGSSGETGETPQIPQTPHKIIIEH